MSASQAVRIAVEELYRELPQASPVESLFIARTSSPGGGVYWLNETDGWVIFRHLATAMPSARIAEIVNGTVSYHLETVV